MANSLFDLLNLSVAQAVELDANGRRHLLEFLLRWEGFAEAQAVIYHLKAAGVSSIELLDQEAQTLAGCGQFKKAIRVMETRLRQGDDLFGWLLYGRYLLESGQMRKALRTANELTKAHQTAPGSWTLLGDVYRTRHKIEEAEAAYLHALEIEQEWPASQIGLMHIHHGRGDGVTATAYAVRAYAALDGLYPIPAEEFQQLLDYFAASNDTNWIRETSRRLQSEFDRELDELKQVLGPATRPAQSEVIRTSSRGQASVDSNSRQALVGQGSPSISEHESIAVSNQDRHSLTKAARDLFGYASLRSPQAEIMACARHGEHVLAILPTGAGKSLCYQLLAFLDPGMTLVVSPLIALMKDQVDNLPAELRTQTVAINSSMQGKALRSAIDRIASGGYRLVYAAPERLRQLPFLHALRQGGISRLVIDEAHCVSIWGHDFRPDYLHVARAHKDLGTPPIMALTATAPPQVRHDIQRQLFGVGKRGRKREKFRVIATDTFRQNLQLSAIRVRSEDDKLDQVITLCRDLVKTGSGIVYARTRRRCEEIAELLRTNGISAEHYHAGIADRANLQERFMKNDVQVVVATIAFGMGVDKSDIRFVIHFGLPDSVESYYQEAGRAGRDDELSRCILLFTNREKDRLFRYAEDDVVSLEHLRLVYKRVNTQLARSNPGLISFDTLGDGLALNRIQLRVALSMLEEVGLVQRHYDSPQTVGIKLLKPTRDKRLTPLIDAAKLVPNRVVSCDFLTLALKSGIGASNLESKLLGWQSAGKLTYSGRGRTVLISRYDASNQLSSRVQSLLDQYATIQRQRVAEIVSYANSVNCRHGHLAAYLGGTERSDCGACDICNERAAFQANGNLPDEREQNLLVLQALEGVGWGWQNLNRLLRGDPDVSQRGQASDAFGRLSFRSETSVEQLITSLMRKGYITEKRLNHGGVALELTQRGRRALREGSCDYR